MSSGGENLTCSDDIDRCLGHYGKITLPKFGIH